MSSVGSRITWAFSSLPALALAVFYALVLATRLVTGSWTTYGNPDAGLPTVPLSTWHVVAGALIAVVIASAILALPLSLTAIWLPALRRPLVVYLLGFAAFATVLVLDPGAYFDWFWD